MRFLQSERQQNIHHVWWRWRRWVCRELLYGVMQAALLLALMQEDASRARGVSWSMKCSIWPFSVPLRSALKAAVCPTFTQPGGCLDSLSFPANEMWVFTVLWETTCSLFCFNHFYLLKFHMPSSWCRTALRTVSVHFTEGHAEINAEYWFSSVCAAITPSMLHKVRGFLSSAVFIRTLKHVERCWIWLLIFEKRLAASLNWWHKNLLKERKAA